MGRQLAIPRRLFVIVVLLRATPLFAQFDFPAMSGTSAGMGGITVAVNSPSTAHISVADLATISSASVSLSVRQNLLAEGLGMAGLAVSKPISFGGFALSLIHYGDVHYSEQSFSLAYAIPLADNVSLGAAFIYLHSATSDPYYDPLHRITFSLALRYSPSDQLSFAFRAYNPLAVLSDNLQGTHTPSIFNLGASYMVTDELLAAAEVEKNLYYDATLRVGLQYSLTDNYSIRAGLATRPVMYSFGLGSKWKHFGADIAVQYCQVLGVSPLLSIIYLF